MIATVKRYAIKGMTAPSPITSDAQNDYYTTLLHDMVMRRNLTAAQEKYAELLTVLIEAYEDERYPIRAATPHEVLKELMTANRLKQKDLASVFGSESIVSEVLHGKRELNKKHIQKLSERFHVSPAVFF